MRTAIAAVLFAATWLLWSGHYSFLLLALGAASCLLVLLLASKIGFFDVEVYALHLGPRLPRFWLWLLKEIARSNVSVACIVLNPRLPIEPTIISIDARHLPLVSQATLANSMTLTPGTVSMDVDRGYIEVHCLTRKIAEDLRDGEMVDRATKLTGA